MSSDTYGLRAHVRMPQFRVEFHDGWFERVFRRDFDGNIVRSTGIGSIGRTGEAGSQVGKVVGRGSLNAYSGNRVVGYVG